MYYSSSLYRLSQKKDVYVSVYLRYISKSSGVCQECSKKCSKATGKITVYKKKMPVTKDALTPIEWKAASNVIKRLNWENSCLFGRIRSTKPLKKITGENRSTKVPKQTEKVVSDQVIQHESQVPIIEPSYEDNDLLELNANLDEKNNSINFKALLTFPLTNELSLSNTFVNNDINEWNILRKDLEHMCKKGSFPSVSVILEKTMPKQRIEILNQWKKNMIAKLGEDGFQKYHKELLSNGAALHNIINNYLTSPPESELLLKEENMGHWKSLKHIFPNIKDVKLLEEFVTHPFLCYRGVVDCFAKYKNHLVVIDWKTSKKLKGNIKSTYDNPLQIAAYVGALNFDPKFQYLARNGLIVIAYENGSPATTHFIDDSMLLEYWNQWLQRVKEFWEMKITETV